jgi:hypothetical protein
MNITKAILDTCPVTRLRSVVGRGEMRSRPHLPPTRRAYISLKQEVETDLIGAQAVSIIAGALFSTQPTNRDELRLLFRLCICCSRWSAFELGRPFESWTIVLAFYQL